ncbi:MAG: response regulator transcription factor [Byssovorax sp.]
MKIMLVDDHQMLRDGLRAVLAREPGYDVVGEAADGVEALLNADQLHPDVVVMDISMPGMSGVEATRKLLAAQPGAKVVALSVHADRRYVQAMLKAGAAGYLVKNDAAGELLQALRAVAAGKNYVSPGVSGAVVKALAGSSPDPDTAQLSPRELEVLKLLAEGASSKDIAAKLGLGVATVESHRRQIAAKLKIHSMAELTKYAIRHGLTSVD